MFKIGSILAGFRAMSFNKIMNCRLVSNLSPNYYAVLGLEPRASEDNVKSAYYELSKKYHPDRNLGDETSTKKIFEINEAFEVLGNKTKKVQYDETFFPVKEKTVHKAHFIYEHSEFYEPPINDSRVYRKKNPYSSIQYVQYARHTKGVKKRKNRHAHQKYDFCKCMGTKKFSFL
nr:dnaJ homolog subfamily B member 9-like [Parasteatoda tepidariorum]